MKGLVYAVLALGVMGLGFWAYRENYATQAAIRDLRDLRFQIEAGRARLDRLEAEWAYLNRPDRLRDLAEINFDRLELLPMMPDAFGRVEDVALAPDLGDPLDPLAGPLAGAGAARPGEEPL